MYQREAMWLNFHGAHWRPNALKVAVGKVNALSGERYHRAADHAPRRTTSSRRRSRGWTASTRATGFIKQFVAMPLGSGATRSRGR